MMIEPRPAEVSCQLTYRLLRGLSCYYLSFFRKEDRPTFKEVVKTFSRMTFIEDEDENSDDNDSDIYDDATCPKQVQ